jgi:NAD(P)-dependent dehydrogenase (short-subunit alcohol dehydrogenase family)
MNERPLSGKVALVAGATRGCGRAIAVELGAAGATVYCTGRSVRGAPSSIGRAENIDETAEMVAARGGTGIAVRVDHTEPDQVADLFARIEREQGGRLDVLVNDVWGGETLTEWGTPFWKHDLDKGLQMLRQAVLAHLITARYGTPLLLAGERGLLLEVTDGTGYDYRGSLYYSLCKINNVHLATGFASDLKDTNVTALAVTPGFLRSEQMLDHFGVTEANWRDAGAKDPHFLASETPYYLARGIAALAADPDAARWAGKAVTSSDLAGLYGVTDLDGSMPNWGRYYAESVAKEASGT